MLTGLLGELKLMLRILTFTATPVELDRLGPRSIAVGLPLVWLVGYGRWWDEPRDISWPHRIGLGSVGYVFILGAVLWVTGAILARREFGYGKVLAFVTYTALPAVLYAIPVERFSDARTAIQLNIAFLGAVSLYRVSLLLWFFRRGAGMPIWDAVVAGLAPLGLISFGLVFFGMAEGIIEIMGGLRESGRAAESVAAVSMISCVTVYSTPLALILYGFAVARKNRERSFRD